MTTQQRAAAIAEALGQSESDFRPSAQDLVSLVSTELGHEEILEKLIQLNDSGIRCRAISPKHILHILSGNTSQAAIQSLTRGLLLGSHNWCKLPSVELPEFERFLSHLPSQLSELVECSHELPDEWMELADVVVAFGNDETIASIHARTTPSQRFIPHGHKLSFCTIFSDPDYSTVDDVAEVTSVYDQQGCLSPHVIYVAQSPRRYARELADAMDRHNLENPRGPISMGEHAQIQELRDTYDYLAADGADCAVWQSSNGTDWTVIYDAHFGFRESCLNRLVYVKPMPENLAEALAQHSNHISTIGCHPATDENIAKLANAGMTRICRISEMQSPTADWHQDGMDTLRSMVRWLDVVHVIDK